MFECLKENLIKFPSAFFLGPFLFFCSNFYFSSTFCSEMLILGLFSSIFGAIFENQFSKSILSIHCEKLGGLEEFQTKIFFPKFSS